MLIARGEASVHPRRRNVRSEGQGDGTSSRRGVAVKSSECGSERRGFKSRSSSSSSWKSFDVSDIRLILQLSRQQHMSTRYTKTITVLKKLFKKLTK